MKAARKPYNAHTLGCNAQAVLKAFYAVPASQRPTGLDIHQGIEFFVSETDNGLCRRVSSMSYVPMSNAEEAQMFENLCAGAVELYTLMPTGKVLLHAATGRPLPIE
ncbi:hypothetical protein [Halomonas sp. KO116]|uniref:hypothetical protein n=1 Tax=Halomonas sp. KO116 TaxID=1504981 RepID=UPI0004E415E6|nr:hypothetical protein [Halomonas sp. KO116]AJY53182.1 hypothetical protein KO116_P200075 [Halomonas sp. KO116]